jgi:hypothetical protein
MVRAMASNASTLMAILIMGQTCAFGPARQYQAKTVLRGLLAQFGRLSFDQGELFDQTLGLSHSDHQARR